MAIIKPSHDLCCIIHHRNENYGEKYGHTTAILRPFNHVYSKPDPAPYDDPIYGHFTLSSQYDASCSTKSVSYGWRYGFTSNRSDMITLEDIDKFGPYLKVIQKKFEKICDNFSYPVSLGQYIVYLMQAVGVTTYAYQSPSGVWHWTDQANSARYHVDDYIDAWHTKNDVVQRSSEYVA
jgi:hypothetical protein